VFFYTGPKRESKKKMNSPVISHCFSDFVATRKPANRGPFYIIAPQQLNLEPLAPSKHQLSFD
jgi:hypothetical protein